MQQCVSHKKTTETSKFRNVDNTPGGLGKSFTLFITLTQHLDTYTYDIHHVPGLEYSFPQNFRTSLLFCGSKLFTCT